MTDESIKRLMDNDVTSAGINDLRKQLLIMQGRISTLEQAPNIGTIELKVRGLQERLQKTDNHLNAVKATHKSRLNSHTWAIAFLGVVNMVMLGLNLLVGF